MSENQVRSCRNAKTKGDKTTVVIFFSVTDKGVVLASLTGCIDEKSFQEFISYY